jgi:hypothetical protein
MIHDSSEFWAFVALGFGLDFSKIAIFHLELDFIPWPYAENFEFNYELMIREGQGTRKRLLRWTQSLSNQVFDLRLQ